jgi:hypothetical protein
VCVEDRLVYRCVAKVSVGLKEEGRVFCVVWKKDQYCVGCMCGRKKNPYFDVWKKRCLQDKKEDCFVVCERKMRNSLCVKKEKLSECTTTKSSEITCYREI